MKQALSKLAINISNPTWFKTEKHLEGYITNEAILDIYVKKNMAITFCTLCASYKKIKLVIVTTILSTMYFGMKYSIFSANCLLLGLTVTSLKVVCLVQ